MGNFRDYVDKINEKLVLDEAKKNEENKKKEVIDNNKELKKYLNKE